MLLLRQGSPVLGCAADSLCLCLHLLSRSRSRVRTCVMRRLSQLHPFSVYDYIPEDDQQLEEGKKVKKRASTFSSVAHVAKFAAKFRSPSRISIREGARLASSHEEEDLIVSDAVSRDSSPSMLSPEDGCTPRCARPPGHRPARPPASGTLCSSGVDAPGESASPLYRNASSTLAHRASVSDSIRRSSFDEMEIGERPKPLGGDTYSQVFITPAGDWTRTLSDNVKQWSSGGGWVAPCWVQGPFLSPFSAAVSHGRLLLVASGIGLSAALPLVQQLHTCEREFHLVWTTRSLEQLAYQLPLLAQCTSCFIFYTGKVSPSAEVYELISSLQHVGLYTGRPQLDKLLAWLVSQRSSTVRNALKGELRPRRRSFCGSLLGETTATRVTPFAADVLAMPAPDTGRVRRKSVQESIADDALEAGSMLLPSSDEEFNSVDVAKVQNICRSKLKPAEAWCLLYCGAVPTIRKTLTTASKNSKFHYAEESFNW